MKLPKLIKGYKREYLQCKQCKGVFYRDYVPFSLSTPVMWSPCGHSIGHQDYNWKTIAKEQFLKKLNIK